MHTIHAAGRTSGLAGSKYADALDSILAFGDLIDVASLLPSTETWPDAVEDGFLVLANPSNSRTLYKLTESGRRFLSEYATAGRHAPGAQRQTIAQEQREQEVATITALEEEGRGEPERVYDETGRPVGWLVTTTIRDLGWAYDKGGAEPPREWYDDDETLDDGGIGRNRA